MKFPTFWSVCLIASWRCHLSCSSVLHIAYKLVVRSKVLMTFSFEFFGKMTSHVVLCPICCIAEQRRIVVRLSHQPNLNVQACLRAQLSSQSDSLGFPGGSSGKELACQCRRCNRCGFDPWVGKIPWRREWQPTPVFFPGESHEQRSLACSGPQGHKESDKTEAT